MEPRQTDIRAEYETAILGRRKSPRAPVSLDAKLGRGGLDRTLCRVTDLSREGARISSYSALKKDAVIWLTLPGIGQIAATVRWADDFQAGCQFNQPLEDGQFEALLDVAR
ncbi:PilZ domain-containing protein [Sphingomonas bacterium]|uniref:PilZ domain-containing protein n=1 Tax=Sphingomonas bacterium TaxID=1895847 RepID=UPI002622F4C7|nr:PilZ domain-containing protein [Sphingomonas bacterium]MDB5677165.1 pilus assembly protein PilZ [Sphingomonas bacterium]